jgi:acyl-CoA synthetase (NDP forming)
MKGEKEVSLKPFFEPMAIAIIGASEDKNKVGGILLKKAMQSAISIIPVNPSHETLFGDRCFKDVSEFKGKIDLAVIAIPAEHVLSALESCGKKGIQNVIIISAGFSEMGNIKAAQELLACAKKYNIRFIGTNCFGICNPKKNLDLTFSISMPHTGNIAFVSQSGALWSYISDLSAKIKEHFGFSQFVSLGNMDDLEFDDFIKHFANDKNTKSIVLYIEKLKDGKKFIELAKKCKKKIFAVKGGSSETGKQAEFSHTASLASDYKIYKGAMRQAGVVLCDSLVEAFEKASGKPLVKISPEKLKVGKKVFIITNAGGAGVLFSDYLSNKGFNVIEKPMDILGTAMAKDYATAFNSVKDKPFDSLIVILTPQSMSQIEATAEAIIKFQATTNKKVVPLFLGGVQVKRADYIFKSENMKWFNTLEQAQASLEF